MASLSRGAQLLIGGPLVLIIGAVIIIGVVFFVDTNSKQRTSTAQAEVVSAVPISWVESRKTKYGYRVEYRFRSANGQTVSSVDQKNTLYEPGFKFRVCYDPNNPSDSDLRHPSRGSDCGKGLLF
jgi:hypothetical protein